MTGQTTAQAEIIPYIFYRDVPAALGWLARAFGFVEELRTAAPRGGIHAQMTLGGRRIMLGASGSGAGVRDPAEAPTQGVFAYIGDVAAHHERALGAGAAIDAPPADHGYGLTYTARDPEGHPWYFTQRPPG